LKFEIINTGTELLLGNVLNTHQQWLCQRLFEAGYRVERQVCVPDTGEAIQAAIREALARADVVICTGGLGPTSDDLTRDLVAQMLGRKLLMDEQVRGEIRNFFAKRNRPQPARTEVQALVPEGARVLPNAVGTAPGLAMEVSAGQFRSAKSWLFMLPGPPRELHPMFLDYALPMIRSVMPLEERLACRVLRTSGIGESMVEERIAGALEDLVGRGLELGYCARTGEVDVRFVGAAEMVSEAEQIVRKILGSYVFGTDDQRIEQVVIHLLTDRKQTLAIAESCTGGLVDHRITNVPGASAVLLAGLVTYSNDAKQKFLGVSAASLKEHGAVSEVVAKEMAGGVREHVGADYGLAVTGIAGPSGGTDEKPVGTVFIGLASAERLLVKKLFNPYDRETFKHVTSQQALDLLRRFVLKE
jgi:competence/damage-inducible protein CinA-like protein